MNRPLDLLNMLHHIPCDSFSPALLMLIGIGRILEGFFFLIRAVKLRVTDCLETPERNLLVT